MANVSSISLYDKPVKTANGELAVIANTRSDKTIPFDIFLENIRDGVWEDHAHKVRCLKTKEERTAAKKLVPYVTIAGVFSVREDNGIVSHSGYLAMDFDGLEDPQDFKSQIAADPYCVAAFISISGTGICAIFRVDPKKHREAHQGLAQYLFEKYGEPCDPTSINISRPRFVSYDPHIFINDCQVEKFTLYPKQKAPKKIEKSIYAKNDFEFVLEQIVSRGLNICDSYHEWLRISFSFVHQFGDAGREYFHLVSQFSTKYDSYQTDKQYDACIKHKGSSEATIAMFYYYAKQAGCEIYSERTRKIAYSAAHGKAAGLSYEAVADNLKKFEEIEGEDVLGIVRQVMDNNIELNDDSLIDQVELWLRQNFELRRNALTRYIEHAGTPLQQKDFNSIFIKAKKLFDKLTFELMDRLINSDFVPTYNPIHEFFAQHKEMDTKGHIQALYSCLNTPDKAYAEYFGTKWLVSLISAAHGEHSPLMLVLSGDTHGTGKTEFFRRLVPKELFPYYAESKLDAGKDDEILMTQKWLIMDDEMGGKSKKESKRLKELTSKQWFSLREPYGRNNVDLMRLAVLCGTTNDNEILNDPTGNRRIIPIRVDSIDHSAYNAVNKTALLMEAYHLWKSGFVWQLTTEDIAMLKGSTSEFETSVMEAELVAQYFEVPPATAFNTEALTATQIKVDIEAKTNQRLTLDRVGKELKRMGFQQKHVRNGTTTQRVYIVSRKTQFDGSTEPPPEYTPSF